jgi:hypothetical protein
MTGRPGESCFAMPPRGLVVVSSPLSKTATRAPKIIKPASNVLWESIQAYRADLCAVKMGNNKVCVCVRRRPGLMFAKLLLTLRC